MRWEEKEVAHVCALVVPVVVVCTVRILIVMKCYATGMNEGTGKRGAPGESSPMPSRDGDQWGGKGKMISVRFA